LISEKFLNFNFLLSFPNFPVAAKVGGRMAPHVDLSKRTPGDARASTRTFLLYLANPGDASAVRRRTRAWRCARGAAATHSIMLFGTSASR